MSVRLLLGAGLAYARRLPLAPSPILSCCAPHLHTGVLWSLTEGARAAHTGSKEAGYYRLQNPKHINIDPCVYEIRTMRGSGPGGQGTNSSSNKVELRADMELLSEFFDDELLAALRRHEAGGALTSDGTTIVVSCHEHRSALQNKEGCLRKLQTLLHKASWVPPAEAGLVERPSFIVTEQKARRRKKSNMNRMTRSARSGSW
ncbi:RF-1 domain containing protein [Leishmania donovani]|uniref:RF-1 domain containing protein, putative n=1 Tax=Leishmania donovani TaxID=5661 RepID=A0A3S7X372_LEIDO|nr:hypothetical protein, conserved [Leishmania donovani]AYU80909.1 RF-1 domain containing protein, putative [Leishmania donovani]TPP43401.1 RF-1 domain family protein [Leishmania donovani]TPP45677.1 RF-1 domain family protein [Leishmania donovani]CAJ1990895.1 RF-1 domain containing protein [Leishmania donovani]CBZ36133.1 hypothetical protein, conserved [Leishmania donovani]